MKKKIKLTESGLRNLIYQTIKEVINEGKKWHEVMPDEFEKNHTDYEDVDISPEEYKILSDYDGRNLRLRDIHDGIRDGWYGIKPGLRSFEKYKNRDQSRSKDYDMRNDFEDAEKALHAEPPRRTPSQERDEFGDYLRDRYVRTGKTPSSRSIKHLNSL